MLASKFKAIKEFEKKFKDFQQIGSSGNHGVFVLDDSFKIYNYLVIVVYVSILHDVVIMMRRL